MYPYGQSVFSQRQEKDVSEPPMEQKTIITKLLHTQQLANMYGPGAGAQPNLYGSIPTVSGMV